MLEKVLRAEPLRFYQYYLGPLDEIDDVIVTQLTDKDIRFLLSSSRIHSTLYLKSRDILLGVSEFYIKEGSVHYFHPNPIVLATLSLLHREESSGFRIILREAEDERPILKFMFWAKRKSLNFLLDSERQSRLLSQVMHSLDYEIKGSASFGGTLFYDYVPGLDTVLSKFAKDENTVVLHGSVLKPAGIRRRRYKKAYLWGLFGHPQLTKLILDNIDGFALCDYSPFPQMPNLRRITSTLLLGAIGSAFSFQYYHDLLAEFELQAPNCQLHFISSSLKVLAASYEAHAGVLQQLATALKNIIQLATRFKNVRFEFTVDVSLTESAQSHREEWLHVVEPLTPSCDIGFEKNCWTYKPDLSAFNGPNTGLQFELEYYFRNTVLDELNGRNLRVLE